MLNRTTFFTLAACLCLLGDACVATNPDPEPGASTAALASRDPLGMDEPCDAPVTAAFTGRCRHRTCFYTPMPAGGICPAVTAPGCGTQPGYCVSGTESLACTGGPTQSGRLDSSCWSFIERSCGPVDPDSDGDDPCLDVVPFHCE